MAEKDRTCIDCGKVSPTVEDRFIHQDACPTRIKRTNHIANAKLESALDKIERAQNLLAHAAEELSSVCWAAPQYSKIGDMYGKVRALWNHVNDTTKRKKIYIDSSNEKYELERFGSLK